MVEIVDVAVLVKVVPSRVDVNAVTGQPTVDASLLTVSSSDRAALAVALSLAATTGGQVDVICACAPAGEAALRDLAADDVRELRRLALAGDHDLAADRWLASYPSELVARVLAEQVVGYGFVVAGEHSLDRGSATVPSRVAQRLGYAQALGLLEVDAVSSIGVRRLDGGWREKVRFTSGTVLSVEGSAGRLPRSSLRAVASARVNVISVATALGRDEGQYAPYRAPTAVVPAPLEVGASRRAMEVIGALSVPKRREVVTTDPASAAALIVETLARWGYR